VSKFAELAKTARLIVVFRRNRRIDMKRMQVLGTGCAKCTKLKENAEAAAKELGVDATVEKVEDINEITGYGVMMTPALVIDGQVKAVGKVLTVDDIKKMLV
jgi:small redox-active disulfide protein 2